MLKIYSFLLLLTFSFVNYSQNQAEAALEWENGMYRYYANQSGNSTFNFVKKSEYQIDFVKGPDGLINSITIGNDLYVRDSENGSLYVCYFKCTSRDWNLWFSSKSIAVFGLTESKGEIDIKMRGVYGKTLSGSATKWENKIRKAIVTGRVEQEKEEYTSFNGEGLGIKDKEISKIELELVPYECEEVTSGNYFTIGVITTLSDGTVVKSQNLGGMQSGDDYSFNVEGAKKDLLKFDNEHQEDVYQLYACESLEDESIHVTVINQYNYERVYEENVKVNCKPSDHEYAAQANFFTQFDAVYINDQRSVTGVVSTSVIKDRGFEEYIKRLSPIFQEDYSDHYIKVKKDEKFGMVSKSGEIFLACEYDWLAMEFEHGLMLVKRDEKWGFVDKSGEEKIPVIYDRASIEEGFIRVCKGDKWGYLDLDGQVKIPITYDYLLELSHGLIPAQKDDKFGYIDINNKIIIPYKFEKAKSHSEGLAAVKQDGKWGFIDESGDFQIEPKYQWVGLFVGGRALIDNGDPSVDGEVDKYGKETWTPKPTKPTNSSSNNSNSQANSNGPGKWNVRINNNQWDRIYYETESGTQGWIGGNSTKDFSCSSDLWLTDSNYNKIRLIYEGGTGCDQTISMK